MITTLAGGLLKSTAIFGLTLLGALPLGLLVAFGRMSNWMPFRRLARGALPAAGERSGFWRRLVFRVRHALAGFKPVQALVRLYISIMRGTPLMLQLMIIFYGPGLLFGLPSMARSTATVVAFTINYACYFSEIYRGGIESIPKGQYEAGQVLGMTKPQIFFKVVLLQVVKRIMAPMSNEVITLVKDTSLARIIGVYEIIWAGESFIKKGLLWPLFYTGAFYLIFNGVLTILFGYLEKKLDYFRG